ncbi:hypothetical protein KJ359_005050 [Pestalotiopsis sp. 9143b]|nr:hypothetical protein KJ359_005050 [Pestalotiopsis sp. 9143b]
MIRCSDSKTGKDSSDPDNRCGDAKPNTGNCPDGSAPVGGGSETLQAFSDPTPDGSKYSRITFCNDFFKLNTFADAISQGKSLPAAQKKDLSKWDNRARCFFHEVTHLDYFMNAGANDDGLSPFVSDLEVNYDTPAVKGVWYEAYGPYNCRILRNWVDPDPQYSGYFTQRNADNYAFFALAKYVEGQTNQYPSSPSPGRKKPKKEPRDTRTHGEPQSDDTQSLDTDLIDGDEQDPPGDIKYPGCGDKFGGDIPAASISASISSQFASATGTPSSAGTSLPTPTCSSDNDPGFDQASTEDHIQTFCGDKTFWETVLVPPVSVGTGLTSDGRGKAIGVTANYTLPGTTDLLWLGMEFTNDTCIGFSQFTTGTTDREKLDHCTERFDTILNGCQTGTTTAKTGGQLQDVCIVYTIMRHSSDVDPYDAYSKDNGDFTCKQTDVSDIGGDSSPLKNTCTCWYSNYPGLFDTFKMPPSGDCKDTNKADILND